jgi:hypothetical protein
MKVATLAALSVVVVLPAEAGQRHRANVSPKVTCVNDGHCTTFAAAASVASPRRSRPKIRGAIAAAPAAGAAVTPAAPSKTAPTLEARDATAAAASVPTASDPAAAASGAATTTDDAITAPVAFPASKPRAAALDGNGNSAGIIISCKTGGAYRRRRTQRVSKPISMTWKTITGRACRSWAAFGQADVPLRVNIPAEKR